MPDRRHRNGRERLAHRGNGITMKKFLVLLGISVIFLSSCAQLKALRTINAKQEEIIKQLEENNQAFKDAYYREKRSRAKEKDTNEVKIKRLESEVSRLRNARTSREKELSVSNKNLQLQLKSTRDNAQKKQAELIGRIFELETGSARLAVEIEKRDTQIQSLIQERDGARQSLDEKEKMIEVLTSQLSMAQKDSEQLNKDISAKKREIEELGKKFAARNKSDSVLQKRIVSLEESVNKQLSQTSTKSKQIEGLSERLANLRMGHMPFAKEHERIRSALRKKLKVYLDTNNLSIQEDSRGVVVIINANLVFESSSTVVKETSKDIFSALGPILKKYPDAKVTVEGHTDTQPLEKMQFFDNWALSSQRATNVLRFMIDKGYVPSNRIKSVACGEEYPLFPNNNQENRKKNRRVEIVIYF